MKSFQTLNEEHIWHSYYYLKKEAGCTNTTSYC